MDPIRNPTEEELVAVFTTTFPLCRLSESERTFLGFIHTMRSRGVGYGWMRQAIGVAWKLSDPDGYIDDACIIELHEWKKGRT